jgi:superfamily II DNA or RNA helicase
MIQLRDYQLEGNQAVRSAFSDGLHRVGLSVFTGGGKTLMFCALVAELLEKDRRSVILVNRDTLVDQTVRQLQKFVPSRAVGVVKAGRNEVNSPIVVASAQTLSNIARLSQIIPPALTIVDEAHGSVADTYLRYYEHVDAVPGGRGFLIGYSATWVRSDNRGLGDVWEDVVFERDAKWAVRQDPPYLVMPRCIQLGGDLDLSGVVIGASGDYTDRSLAECVMVEDLRDTVVQGWFRFLSHRRSILFAPTQQSARYFGDALKDSGVKVGEIFDRTSSTERRFTFASFANGATQVLTTCTALAEGFDMPCCDAVMLLRPTQHTGLFIQQIGRALRLWPGKHDALITDFVGVTDNKRMRSVVDLSLTPEASDVASEPREVRDGLAPTSKGVAAKKINGVTEVDLFAGTDARWLTTTHGVPFVFTHDNLYWVAQDGGAWGVGRCSARTGREGQWLVQGLSSAEALEYGSEVALAEDASIAGKYASWRQGNRAPTPAMLDLASDLGVASEGLSKARLSDAISVHRASAILANVSGGSDV